MKQHLKNSLFFAIKIVSLTLGLIGFVCASDDTVLSEQPTENLLCTKIATYNLRSFQRVDGPSMGDCVQDPYAFYNFLTETISNPQPADRRNRAFKILASAENNKSAVWTKETLLDDTTWNDLNLLSGSKDSPAINLASILSEGRTHTELGRAYLCGLLARPTSDVALLESRQNIIKKLIEDRELCDALEVQLKQIAQSETLFTGLWDAELLMQFIAQGYSKLEYVGPMINNSSLCLELGSLVNITTQGAATAIMAISPVVLTLYGLSMLHSGEPVLTQFTGACFGQLGLAFEMFPVLKNRWIQGVTALIAGTVSVLYFKQAMQQFHTNFKYDDFLKRRLVHVGMYVEAIRTISTTMHKNVPDACSSFTFFNDNVHFFGDQLVSDAELKHFDSLLHSGTFQKGSEEEFSVFFSRGNMLCAYYLLGKIKNKFEGVMAGIGELDAYLTIAKLIRESENSEIKYCFPTYLKDAVTPSVQLSNFWNPFIDPAVVVSNSINLGVEHSIPNMVITGPNSAGKSTILKGIALAIVLAQSLGIAPAQSMTLTPFSYLVTYMNVADSIVDQESRFQAEARRVFEYGDRLEDMGKSNAFSFALFDEIFSGTSPKEGADLGYRVATILGGYKNSMSLVATHFEKLVHLEADTQGRFVNYNVAVSQNSDGSIVFDERGKIKRQYCLVPGFSHQHIAREVFKEKGCVTRSGFFDKCFVAG